VSSRPGVLPIDPASAVAERSRLLELLTRLAYAKRRVVLTSGRESDFYIDCKKVVLTAEGHWLVGRLLFRLIREKAPEATGVGGMTMGADPLASAVSLVSWLGGEGVAPLDAYLVRKEPKGHGSGQWIEGLSAFSPGSKVAVVEDVITTGGSALKAIERIRGEGLVPVATFALVDRLEGGREAIEASGVPAFALFSRGDFPT
jgi:orotate phosphoribosyltransferase